MEKEEARDVAGKFSHIDGTRIGSGQNLTGTIREQTEREDEYKQSHMDINWRTSLYNTKTKLWGGNTVWNQCMSPPGYA